MKHTLEALHDYYTVELQEFSTNVTLDSFTTFSVGGVKLETESFEYGNNGTWKDVPLVNVANLGCNPVSHDGHHFSAQPALQARKERVVLQSKGTYALRAY